MEQLIRTLPRILQASKLSPMVVEAAAIAAWKHAAGQALCDHAMPVAVHDKKLIVVVGDRIWQRQLESLLSGLLSKLNRILGQPLINYIELRVDPRLLEELRGRPRTAKADRKIANEAISPEILAGAAEIKDPHLRRAFVGAAQSRLSKPSK